VTARQFAARLESLNWSQALTAEYLVRDVRTIGRWVHGERPVPKIVAAAIGDASRCEHFERWLVESGRASGDVARRTVAERLAETLVAADIELAAEVGRKLKDFLA